MLLLLDIHVHQIVCIKITKMYKRKQRKIHLTRKWCIQVKILVDKEALVLNIEEYGTSSKGWEKVTENTGASQKICQEMFTALSKEVESKDKIFKKNIMGTGEGPPPTNENDPVLEKVKVLVGPAIDGMYTIYDGDKDLMVSQNKPPLEVEIVETVPKTDVEIDFKTPDSKDYFTNDRSNLKTRPNNLSIRKRKLDLITPSKHTVSDKFKKLANVKMELVELQHELLKTQLEDEKVKLEHNRMLRAMEIDEVKKKYDHNEKLRKLELEKLLLIKQ